MNNSLGMSFNFSSKCDKKLLSIYIRLMNTLVSLLNVTGSAYEFKIMMLAVDKRL